MLSGNFDNPKPTPAFHKTLWELFCSDDKYVAIAAPRGHAKSTAVTHCCALASVLFMQKKNIMILSDTEPQAQQFLSDIRMELEENQELRETFQINGFIKDNEKELIVSMGEHGHRFRITAKAFGGSLRGAKWRGKRPDLIIGDDVENDEMVLSKERRAKLRKWMLATMIPLLSDDGQIRIVGTILHADSALEHLLNKKTWITRRYEAHNDDFTEILWPEKFSKERLLDLRKEYELDGELDIYAQEYRNQPIDGTISLFRKVNFLPIKEPDEYLEYYIGVDLAVSTKTSADFTVFTVVGINAAGKLKVVEVVRERMDTYDSVQETFTLQKRWHPQCFIFEDENINKAIGPFLYKEMEKQQCYPIIETIRPSNDKPTRAQAITARHRAGGIEFDKEAEWYPDFLTELMQFPRSKNDDQVDSFGLVGLHLRNIHEADVTDTPDEDDDYDEYDEYDSMFGGNEFNGACDDTGY